MVFRINRRQEIEAWKGVETAQKSAFLLDCLVTMTAYLEAALLHDGAIVANVRVDTETVGSDVGSLRSR